MRRFLLVLLALLLLCGIALAHSGRTDSSGGHWNHSTGEYHYHHGKPAHQHPNGICPYSTPTPSPTPRKTAKPLKTKSAYVKVTSTPTPSPTPSPTPVIYRLNHLVTTANVNMREGPSTDYEIIVTVPKDTALVQMNTSGNWCYVYYGLKKGWVHSKYVAESSVTPSPKPIPTPTPAQISSSTEAENRLSTAGVILLCMASVSTIMLGVLFSKWFE